MIRWQACHFHMFFTLIVHRLTIHRVCEWISRRALLYLNHSLIGIIHVIQAHQRDQNVEVIPKAGEHKCSQKLMYLR